MALGAFILFLLAAVMKGMRGDSELLQDFCVADTKSSVFTNGLPCLDPAKVTAQHFVTSVLRTPGNTSGTPTAATFIGVNPQNLPGLNTLGITLARIDIAPGGITGPHIHPRGTEISYVLKGKILAGFVEPRANKLFSQTLEAGDVFVVPKGALHYAANVGDTDAVAINALSSQNPGFLYLPFATFASTPGIPKDILAKSFAITEAQVEQIKKTLGGGS